MNNNKPIVIQIDLTKKINRSQIKQKDMNERNRLVRNMDDECGERGWEKD